MERFLKYSHRNRRGMTIIVFILLIVVGVGFLMLQRMTTAVHKAKQTIQLFNASYAMNFAESAIAAGTNIVRAEMNNESGEFYLHFRSPRADVQGLKVNLTSRQEIKDLAEKFDGKIKRLDVEFTAITPIVDKSGNNVSLDNVEKCGAAEFRAEVSYQDTTLLVRSRHDFKVTMTKSHALHNYALMVRDAWGEYSAMPSSRWWPVKYCSKPGSHEGYNPVDHHLTIFPHPEIYYGKIHLGGPMTPNRKIIIDLSDEDTDMMEPLPVLSFPDNRKADNRRIEPDEIFWSKTTSTNVTQAEAKTVFNSVFTKKILEDLYPFDSNKGTISFMRENLGYRSWYKGTSYTSTYYPSDNAAIGENLKDESKWKNVRFPFGTPSYFYENAMKIMASQGGANEDLWTHHRDSKDKGIDLWGDRQTRIATPIEGNVFARSVSMGSFRWNHKDNGKEFNLFVHFPGGVNFTPLPSFPSEMALWNGLFEKSRQLFRDNDLKDSIPVWEYSKDVEGNKLSPRAWVEGAGSGNVRNFDTEINVHPYNYALGHLMKNEPKYKDFPNFLANSSDYTLTNATEFQPFINDLMIYNKCTAFYKSGKDFLEDRLYTDKSGQKRLYVDGRIVVVGNLYFKENIKFDGAGVIITLLNAAEKQAGNILIGGSFVKSNPTSTSSYVTLFSPFGRIYIASPSCKIEAALFCLRQGFQANDPDNQGFIIGPSKSVLKTGTLHIKGAVCVDRLNLPTFPTETIIEYDPALIPSLNDADRHRDYHVSMSRKYLYWQRQSL